MQVKGRNPVSLYDDFNRPAMPDGDLISPIAKRSVRAQDCALIAELGVSMGKVRRSLFPNAPKYPEYYPINSRIEREFRAILVILRAGRYWTKWADQMLAERCQQSRVRWETLSAIAFADGPTTPSAIALRMGVKWPALVRILSSLEEDGLINSVEHPSDGRSRLITLTEQGHDVLVEMCGVIDEARSRIMKNMSDKNLTVLANMLEDIYSEMQGLKVSD